MSFEKVDALLFDLGNVVIHIDFERVFARWAAHAGCDAALLREKFSHDEPGKRYERGEIDNAAYFASLRGSLGVELDDARFLEGWGAIYVGEMPGIRELLAGLAPKIPIYAFTNTNRAHAAVYSVQFAPLLALFERCSPPTRWACASRSRKRSPTS